MRALNVVVGDAVHVDADAVAHELGGGHLPRFGVTLYRLLGAFSEPDVDGRGTGCLCLCVRTASSAGTTRETGCTRTGAWTSSTSVSRPTGRLTKSGAIHGSRLPLRPPKKERDERGRPRQPQVLWLWP